MSTANEMEGERERNCGKSTKMRRQNNFEWEVDEKSVQTETKIHPLDFGKSK